MDLLKVFRSVRRHWVIAVVGIVLGVICALAVTFRLSVVGGSTYLTRRSITTYKSEAQLLISEPGYGMGSAGVLRRSVPDAFGKTQAMAPVYAQLVLSDAVMRAASARIGAIEELVEAEPVSDCPIVKVKVTGTDPERTKRVAVALVDALSAYLVRNQESYGVPEGDRLTVSILAQPGTPAPQQSRGFEIALLAFLLPLFAAVGLGLVLDRSIDEEGPLEVSERGGVAHKELTEVCRAPTVPPEKRAENDRPVRSASGSF
jgi:capsular polysaccharide biosynthesis protein